MLSRDMKQSSQIDVGLKRIDLHGERNAEA